MRPCHQHKAPCPYRSANCAKSRQIRVSPQRPPSIGNEKGSSELRGTTYLCFPPLAQSSKGLATCSRSFSGYVQDSDSPPDSCLSGLCLPSESPEDLHELILNVLSHSRSSVQCEGCRKRCLPPSVARPRCANASHLEPNPTKDISLNINCGQPSFLTHLIETSHKLGYVTKMIQIDANYISSDPLD